MKNTLLIALTLAITTPLTNAIAMILGLYDGNILQFTWPCFFVAILYLIGGNRTARDSVSIMAAAVTGFLWAILCALAIGYLSGIIGPILGMWLGLGGTIFIYAALMGPFPTLFNNYGVMFYLTGCLFASQMTVEWMLVSVLGGVFYMAVTFSLVKVFTGTQMLQFGKSATGE